MKKEHGDELPEAKIIEKYSVELQGWRTSKPGICNPATLGGWAQLEKLLAVLESGKCHWVVLSDGELDERKKKNQAHEECGEQVYRPCKSAKRNGHSNPKSAKSAEIIDDDDDDDRGEQGDQEPATKQVCNDDNNEGEQDKQEPATKRTHIDNNSDDEQGIRDNTAINGDD